MAVRSSTHGKFHRVDPRLRVLKGGNTVLPSYRLAVSSRRPEVEGTESGDGVASAKAGDRFHRVDPRLRVLKGDNGHVVFRNNSLFHRVDPRLRVLKGLRPGFRASTALVSSRRPEVEGTERTCHQFP